MAQKPKMTSNAVDFGPNLKVNGRNRPRFEPNLLIGVHRFLKTCYRLLNIRNYLSITYLPSFLQRNMTGIEFLVLSIIRIIEIGGQYGRSAKKARHYRL